MPFQSCVPLTPFNTSPIGLCDRVFRHEEKSFSIQKEHSFFNFIGQSWGLLLLWEEMISPRLLSTATSRTVVSSEPCSLPAALTASQYLRKQLHQITGQSQGRVQECLFFWFPYWPLISAQTSVASAQKGKWIQCLPKFLSFSLVTTSFPPVVMQGWGTTNSQPARQSPPAATTTGTAPWWPPKPSCIRFLPLDWSPARTCWAQTLSW